MSLDSALCHRGHPTAELCSSVLFEASPVVMQLAVHVEPAILQDIRYLIYHHNRSQRLCTTCRLYIDMYVFIIDLSDITVCPDIDFLWGSHPILRHVVVTALPLDSGSWGKVPHCTSLRSRGRIIAWTFLLVHNMWHMSWNFKHTLYNYIMIKKYICMNSTHTPLTLKR